MNIIKTLKTALLAVSLCAISAATAATPTIKPFMVNQFVLVVVEYVGPVAVAGVSTYGPTTKAALCERSGAAAEAQAHEFVPHGHTMVTT